MGTDRLRTAALAEVRSAHGDQEAARYRAAFDAALPEVGQPLPCPFCFPKGEASRLVPRETRHGIGSVVCSTCHNVIEFAD